MSARALPRMRTLAVALTAFVLVGAGAAQSSASAASGWWQVDAQSSPTNLPPGGQGRIKVIATNVGDGELNGAGSTIVITDRVPAGLEVLPKTVVAYAGISPEEIHPRTELTCTVSGQTVSCPYKGVLPPYGTVELGLTVNVPNSPGPTAANEAAIEGGGAPRPDSSSAPLQISGQQTPFGVSRYALTAENEGGTLNTQAGAHPFQLTTAFDMNNLIASVPFLGVPEPAVITPQLVKDLHFVVPPGLIGNSVATPKCSSPDFSTTAEGAYNYCPPDTAVGVATVDVTIPEFKNEFTAPVPIFNLEPAPGEPARFGFEIEKVPVILTTAVRSGSDYAVEVTLHEATQAAFILRSQVTLWGTPQDPSHDISRGWECLAEGTWVVPAVPAKPCHALNASKPTAFLTMPTLCEGEPISTVTGEAWSGTKLSSEYRFPSFTGCEALAFTPANSPSIKVEPETQAASTPTGMTVKVHVPQESTLSGATLGEPDIRETTLTLPQGVQASAGAADGLEACTAKQAAFTGNEGEEESQLENDHFLPKAAKCPDGSQIGTVSINTPLLEHELTGAVYLASEGTNLQESPFHGLGGVNFPNSSLVLYIIAEDKASGIQVELAGEIQVNSETGQLTSVFRETPPLPFEELSLKLFGGPRASQSTPPKCGTYTSAASFTPWSGGAPATSTSQFEITSGPNGEPCPSNPLPLSPSFQGGAASNQADAFTATNITINHPDSNQPLRTLTVHLPPGDAAMLSSVTPCGEPQASEDRCGPESLIGHSTAVGGLGSHPVSLGGDLYLTGPYKGAPFGVLDATHAEHVGPFDLGDIVVRSTINVDPSTAAATITSDPLPQYVKGFPAQVKAIYITENREHFGFNPTNCGPLSFTATLTGYEGGVANVSSPFQMSNCASLPFTPKLTISTGKTFSKTEGVSFNVKVTSATGQDNIAKTRLVIPMQLPSRLTTIQKACPDSVFNSTPAKPGSACEEGSNIGRGIAHTPVLKNPLEGPAYLVSHGGAAFPDVEFVLKGEGILLVLDGQTNIHNGVTTSTFNSVPDAPVSTFEAILPAGPHSALTAYLPGKPNLCGSNLTVPTTITAQNGAVIQQNTPVSVEGCAGAAIVKVETNAQKLAKALKACRKKPKGKKRVACEKAARKKYATKASKTARGKKAAKRARRG